MNQFASKFSHDISELAGLSPRQLELFHGGDAPLHIGHGSFSLRGLLLARVDVDQEYHASDPSGEHVFDGENMPR